MKGLITKVYTRLLSEMLSNITVPCRQRWETEIDVTLGDIWDQILQNVHLASISPTHRVAQLLILYRAYLASELLHRVGRRENSEYVRCAQSHVSFMCFFWRCLLELFQYWQKILDMLNSVYDTMLTPNLVLCLLSYVNSNSLDCDQRVAIMRSLFIACKLLPPIGFCPALLPLGTGFSKWINM